MTSPTSLSRRPIAARAILAAATLLGVGLAPVLAAEPTALAPDAASATILLVSLDTLGTDGTDDDVLLDGSSFSVRLDDGDRAFVAGLDTVSFGPAPAPGGLLDTASLGPGWYWIETAPPAGYGGPPPLLVELNTDASRTCVWDASGPIDCQANDAGSEGLSWTMVLVRHAPADTPTPTPTEATPTPTPAPTGATPVPTGEVQEATGRPAVTLPPTDRIGLDRRPTSTPVAAWVVALLVSLGALPLVAARSARAASKRRTDRRVD